MYEVVTNELSQVSIKFTTESGDTMWIPDDEQNPDYLRYLAWKAENNK